MCVFVCVLYTGGFVCSTSISHPHMFCIISLVTNINIIIANKDARGLQSKLLITPLSE